MSDDKDQAPDANKAPGQKTPSRSYGRQVHQNEEASDAESAPTSHNGQTKGEDAQRQGSPSE